MPPCAPSHTSTSATAGQSRSIARASSIVRFGRRATSRKLLPAAKLSVPNFWTMSVFGPSWLIESRSDWSKPRMSEVMPTIDVIPMTTPSTVSAERILLVRRVWNDITKISDSSPARRPAIIRLLAPQGFNRVQFRRAHRGYMPKNSPTTAVTPMPATTDQTWTDAGSGDSLLMIERQDEPEERADARRRTSRA